MTPADQPDEDAAKALEDMPYPFDTTEETVGEFRARALKWMSDNYLTIRNALQQRVREG